MLVPVAWDETWSLAGLRRYALGSDVLARLTVQRAHWAVGNIALTAIAASFARPLPQPMGG